MTSTATKPSASGSAAAASEPKTSSRMIRTSGNPAVSALARSSFESSCIAAHSAPWPTSDVVTPSRAPSPAPRFSRRSTARSVAASSSTATRSGTTTVPPAAARRSASARVAAGSATPSTGSTPSPTRATAARSCAGVAPGSGISTAASCARGTPGKPVSASSTAADAEPGTPKPPLERCSDWRAANGSAASRITAQPIRTSRRRRRRRRSRRSIAVCTGRAVLGEEETGWLASQGTR